MISQSHGARWIQVHHLNLCLTEKCSNPSTSTGRRPPPYQETHSLDSLDTSNWESGAKTPPAICQIHQGFWWTWRRRTPSSMTIWSQDRFKRDLHPKGSKNWSCELQGNGGVQSIHWWTSQIWQNQEISIPASLTIFLCPKEGWRTSSFPGVTHSVWKDSWGLLSLDGRYSRRDRRPSSTVDQGEWSEELPREWSDKLPREWSDKLPRVWSRELPKVSRDSRSETQRH